MAFGVIPDDNDAMTLKNHLRTELAADVPTVTPDQDRVSVFTDGSCFFGDRWDCALAGAAVVRVDEHKESVEEVDRFLFPLLITQHIGQNVLQCYAHWRSITMLTFLQTVKQLLMG